MERKPDIPWNLCKIPPECLCSIMIRQYDATVDFSSWNIIKTESDKEIFTDFFVWWVTVLDVAWKFFCLGCVFCTCVWRKQGPGVTNILCVVSPFPADSIYVEKKKQYSLCAFFFIQFIKLYLHLSSFFISSEKIYHHFKAQWHLETCSLSSVGITLRQLYVVQLT